MDNGWKKFFDNHAPKYMEEPFTKNTAFEVDFVEKELQLSKGCAILDVGCGTGRHSIELAKRGYRVTGIDISKGMLEQAKRISEREGLSIDFIQADAADFELDAQFDACICLCEGAFGLLSMDEDPYERDIKILGNIHKALKPGGKFLLTALNGLRMIRMYNDDDVAKGKFDQLSVTEIYPLKNIFEEAEEGILIKEKGFIASELNLMMKITGFKVEHIWGGTAGNWNKQPLKMDEMELMVLSERV